MTSGEEANLEEEKQTKLWVGVICSSKRRQVCVVGMTLGWGKGGLWVRKDFCKEDTSELRLQW